MKNKKLLAVASQGGHLIQLMRLKPVFDQYDASYVSNEYHEAMGENFIAIVDANRDAKCKLIVMFMQILWIIIRIRPDVVISTGAAPGYFALMLGRLLGAKTIWLLTQWPAVAHANGPQYGGRVL